MSNANQLPFEALNRILIYLCRDGQPIGRQNNPMTVKELAVVLPPASLSDVQSFRLVNHKWNNVYRLRFEPLPKLLGGRGGLPAELIDKIVEYLAPRKAWPNEQRLIDNRSTLSLESFSENRDPRENGNPLKAFRLVCREFSKQPRCLEHLFARVTTRFSLVGFERLQEIVLRRMIREKVRKFTYMVPRFFDGDIYQLENTLKQQRSSSEILQASSSRQAVSAQQRASLYERKEKMIADNIAKAKGQSRIINEGIDSRVLMLAFVLFANLQQVKLLRVVHQDDEQWSRCIIQAGQAPLSWVQAYEHATSSLANAFLASGNKKPFHFSCQFVDVRTPLTPGLNLLLPDAVHKLRFLTLQLIDEGHTDMTFKVLQLSQFCSDFMRQTRDFKGLHIGFSKVISAPLESVFQNMRWHHLRYFGIHMWSLDGDEIIKLLRRHRNLRSVRLRQIYLKEGSRWEDVLRVIKQEFNLKWLSLFRIGYQRSAGIPLNYVHDEDSDDEYPHDNEGSESGWEGSQDGEDYGNESDGTGGSAFSPSGSEEGEDDEDDEEGNDNNNHAFQDDDSDHEGANGQSASLDLQREPVADPNPAPPPPLEREAQAYTLPECKCHDPISIPDNGVMVEQAQYLSWERWAVDNCKRHQVL